jgi:hypothetical protein
VNPNEGDLFGGLATPGLSVDVFEFGEGLSIARTYARLMTPLILSGTAPSKSNPIGTPVRSVPGSFEFEISAELRVPKTFSPLKPFDRLNMAWLLAALLRLRIAPGIVLPVLANRSFGEVAGPQGETISFWPMETEPRQLRLRGASPRQTIETHHLEWVRNHWRTTLSLMISSPEFNLSLQACDRTRTARTHALGLLQVWGALEALFSVGHGELRFRTSALIASFLKPIGLTRLAEQKRVALLYDARSAAAHGRDEDAEKPLDDSFELLGTALVKMIELGAVPTRETLESILLAGA